jgi:hypothetical protein
VICKLVLEITAPHDCFKAEGTYLGEGRFVQIGFPGGYEYRCNKGIPEDRIEMRLQARIGLQHPTDAVTLLLDGRLPAPSAPLGLVLPLQQISQEHDLSTKPIRSPGVAATISASNEQGGAQ